MTDYYLKVFNTSGVLQAVVTDFTALSYLRKVNSAGLLTLTLRGDHSLVSTIQDKWIVEVWRRPDGGAFGRDFVGLYRMGEFYYGDDGPRAVLTCPGALSMLGWRIVAWYAGTANRSKFTAAAAETIMKTLVSYNAGSAATTANGRLRNGAISGMTVEADGAGGNSVDWFCAYENLLETLSKLADVAGGDFDLARTGDTTWQFRWYAGQLGSDRTASVIFAIERGNMANPAYKSLRIDERTVCVVGGDGEDSDRDTAVRTGPDYAAGNDIEVFLNASGVDTSDGLNARGDAALQEEQAQEQFGFDVIQTPATVYGVHYGLGDLVTAVNPFTGASMTLKIDETAITLDENGAEKIDVRMANA